MGSSPAPSEGISRRNSDRKAQKGLLCLCSPSVAPGQESKWNYSTPFLLLSPGSLAAASWPLHSPVALSVGLRGQGEVVEEVQKATYAAASAAAAVAPGPSGKGRGQQESWAGMRAVQSKDIRNDQGKAHRFFSDCHPFSCLGTAPLSSTLSALLCTPRTMPR